MCPTQQHPTKLPWLGLFSAVFFPSPLSPLPCLFPQMMFAFSPNSFKNTTWSLLEPFDLGSSSIAMLESSQHSGPLYFSAASRHDHILGACYLWLTIATVWGGIPRSRTWDRIQISTIFLREYFSQNLIKNWRKQEREEKEWSKKIVSGKVWVVL